MTAYQYSNSNLICFLLVFVSSVSFIIAKPISQIQLWNPQKVYLTPFFSAAFSLFVCACTVTKKVDTKSVNLKRLTMNAKQTLTLGNSFLIFTATISQIILVNINWQARYSFSVFLLSNLIMATICIFTLSDRLDTVANYKYQFLIPVFTYAATMYVYPFTAPGDCWLYNFYYNCIMSVSAIEMYAVMSDNVRLRVPAEENQAETTFETDSEDVSEVSSDEDWETVDNIVPVF